MLVQNSALLWLLGLLTLPMIIHLLNRGELRELPFATLKFITDKKLQHYRKLKWHQMLLLILRLLTMTALILYFANLVIPQLEMEKVGSTHRLIDQRLVIDEELPDVPESWTDAQQTTLIELGNVSLSSQLTNWQAQHPDSTLQLVLGDKLPLEPTQLALPVGTQLEIIPLSDQIQTSTKPSYIPEAVIVFMPAESSAQTKQELAIYEQIIALWQNYFEQTISFQVQENLPALIQQIGDSSVSSLVINLSSPFTNDTLDSLSGLAVYEAQRAEFSKDELPILTRELLSSYQKQIDSNMAKLIATESVLLPEKTDNQTKQQSVYGQQLYWLWLALILFMLERIYSEWRLRHEHG